MLGRFFVWIWSLIIACFAWSYRKLRAINWGAIRRVNWRPWLVVVLLFPLYWVNRGEFISMAPPVTIWGWIIRLFVSLMIVGMALYLAIKFARMRRGSHPLEWVLSVPTVLLLLYIWGGLSFAPAPQFEDVTLVSPSEVEEVTSPDPSPVTPDPTRVVGQTSRPEIAGRTLSDLDLYVVTRGDQGSAFALVSLVFAEWGSDHPVSRADLLSLTRWIESENGREIREEFSGKKDEVQARKLELLAKNGVKRVGTDGSLIPFNDVDRPILENHLSNLGF